MFVVIHCKQLAILEIELYDKIERGKAPINEERLRQDICCLGL